jgi:hypothetical protein
MMPRTPNSHRPFWKVIMQTVKMHMMYIEKNTNPKNHSRPLIDESLLSLRRRRRSQAANVAR